MPGSRVIANFITELRRRRVLHIGGIYIAGAWATIEIASFLLEQAMAPAWTFRLLAILFVVGFPVSMVLAWVIQIQPDGHWAIDPSGGQAKTIIGAVALGLVATAGLSWLILPQTSEMTAEPAYTPFAHSVAILPFAAAVGITHDDTIAETLHTALRQGMEQSAELIPLDFRKLKEQPGNLVEFGQSVRAATILTGKILPIQGGTTIEMTLLDVSKGSVTWTQSFDWNPTRIGEIGTAIANGVLTEMTLPELSQEKFTGSKNPQAYDAFLMGERRAASYNTADLLSAMDDFQRAIDLDPGYVLAYVGLAETIGWYIRYRSPGQSETQALAIRAGKALKTAQALDSESAAVVSALGVMSGNRVLAIQAIEHALELDPNHARSYHRLGRIMEAEDKLEEAERLLRKALELDPLNADWHNDLGGVLYHQMRDAEAIAQFCKSAELEPKLIWNHYRLGFYEAYDSGNLDEAMIHFREAYALDPENIDPVSHVTGLYLDMGAREETWAWLERSLQLSTTSPMVLLTAYQVHSVFGDEETALEYAGKLSKLNPEDHLALMALGKRDIETGHPERAIERWQSAYPNLTGTGQLVVDENNWYFARAFAQTLMEAGETERARHLLHGCLDVLNGWKNDPSVRKSYVYETEPGIYASLGMKKETLDAMRRAIIDGHQRGALYFHLSNYDFIRNEPEFMELMELLRSDLNSQLKRVREMECKGELAPAPGVTLDQACN